MGARTKRQRQVLEYLTNFINERGYEPSYQQIARAIGIRSKGAVAKHIVALEKQGLISRRRDDGSFGIELLRHKSIVDGACRIDWLEIPSDSDPPAEKIESLIVPKSLLGTTSPNNLRAFKILSDSMLPEHICRGDIALVEERSFARDRDCVIALVKKKRTLIRKFYRRGAEIELRPADNEFELIRLPADEIEIIAIYRGLLRPLH